MPFASVSVRVFVGNHSYMYEREFHQQVFFHTQIITITYKALHGLAPTYIKDVLKHYHPLHDLTM